MFGLASLGVACASPDESTSGATTSTVQAAPTDSQTDGGAGPADTDADTTTGTGEGDPEPGADDETTTSESTPTDDAPTSADWVGQAYALEPVVDLDEPIALVERPGSTDLWIAERSGRVRRVSTDGEAADEVVLDLTDSTTTDGERGLLGLAFSTDGGLLYVSYTDTDGASIVAEYAMGDTSAAADSARVLLDVAQPFPNHNGGQIAVGPDGLLYIGLGDGGGGGDPERNGQNADTLLGSIVRIDPTPSGGEEYTIPADNPFFSGGGAPEIFLFGLRNPWRFSFDEPSGDLWIADVGQNLIEEITVIPSGTRSAGSAAGNLGWPILEGNDPFDGDQAPDNHIPPLFTYQHADNRCSVTGGYVYRGPSIQNLTGAYTFGDFCTGEIFGLQELASGEVIVGNLVVDRQVDQLISFGAGPDGELYVLEAGGQVSRLTGQ